MKIQTWDKVKTLLAEKLTIHQVARILGIDRKTVRKYRDMSQKQIESLVESDIKRRICKLEPYRAFVASLLKEKPMLSSPQVHDRLLEAYPTFPDVSPRTVFSFVKQIRSKENIPIHFDVPREYSKVEQHPYGKQAQVDFGEMFIDNNHGGRTKVYFMLMVLSRSCYKFAWFQSCPFTAETAIYAHHMAFRYFKGFPEEIVYDQDVKFLVDENYGKYKMTESLDAYVKRVGFKPVFMMARDPQSKGLAEVYIKYIKYNFLRGRVFVNDEILNDEFLAWADRTGNKNRHSVYRFIPSAEFGIEQNYLNQYTEKIQGPAMYARSYVVRKDNVISYKGNIYSLPKGTYKNKRTRVLVVLNAEDKQIEIYEEGTYKLLTIHDINEYDKGKVIIKPEHKSSAPSTSLLKAEVELKNMMLRFNDEYTTNKYLEAVYNAGPRYYRKSIIGILHYLNKITSVIDLENIIQSMQEQRITNPNDLKEMIDAIDSVYEESIELPNGLKEADVTPASRDISEYNKYF